MLLADFVIGANDGAFQQTPDILDPIGMNITGFDPFLLAVIDALMFRVMVAYTKIRFIFIGNNNFRIRGRMVFDELMEGLPVGILNPLHPNLAVSLNDANH